MTSAGESFDVAALTALCARWPAGVVPSNVADDSLLERVRQVLRRFRDSPREASNSDFVPLIRHVLLRAAGEEGVLTWLRIPVGGCWPSAASWEDAQFDVLDDSDSLRVRPRWPRLSFLTKQRDLYDDAFKGIVSRPRGEVRADPLLLKAMGLPTYTGEGQREAVRALLQLPAGYTLIANLPTGSGKSLLAQLPPLLEANELLTLAIVPTVALAIDQAARMRALLQTRYPHRDLPPLAFHGGLSPDEKSAVRRAIRQGMQPILFTSPEYAVGSLRGVIEEATANGWLKRVFIDEAHLVIGWGNGFRPAFQLLPALVRVLRASAPGQGVNVVLASATLSESTIRDLRQLFGPPESIYIVSAVHLRPEVRYAFLRCEEAEREARVLEAVRLAPRPFILYVTRPEETDKWLSRLHAEGFRRLKRFSGETSASERERILNEWAANELDGVVATSAFGLGVDKSDVRTIIHATLPDSIDRYYQEVGRAGRDGRASAALLLHTPSDHDQARGLAFPRLIGDENGYERWSMLIGHAVQDANMPDVSWIDLDLLPAHLRVRSEASKDWNVRALTLMARAQLIELVSLANRQRAGDDVPNILGDATHAAIRILDDGHRNPEVFNARMTRARQDVYQAGKRGFDSMYAVSTGNLEISTALRRMYSASQGAWVPVVVCCGGCPVHWENRREHVQYHPPMAPRLTRFARRSLRSIDQLSLPLAATNLLLVDVAPNLPYAETCAALVSLLAPALECHTIALESGLARKHARAIERALPPNCSNAVFFDTIDADVWDRWPAGTDEVRIIIWSNEQPPAVPDALHLSDANLEILVVPSWLPHSHHPFRHLIDTTPHVHAADLMQMMTT